MRVSLSGCWCVAALRLAGCWCVAALGLAGCGVFGSAASNTVGTPAKVARADTTHEYPAPPPPRETTSSATASAAAAIRRFTAVYINWNARTVTRQMQVLALASIGQARSAMALAAAQTENDYELKHGGIANRGVIEAITPLPGHRNEFVVVTREQTTATNTAAYAGLPPAWHVTVAAVTEVALGQWVVSRWQPET